MAALAYTPRSPPPPGFAVSSREFASYRVQRKIALPALQSLQSAESPGSVATMATTGQLGKPDPPHRHGETGPTVYPTASPEDEQGWSITDFLNDVSGKGVIGSDLPPRWQLSPRASSGASSGASGHHGNAATANHHHNNNTTASSSSSSPTALAREVGGGSQRPQRLRGEAAARRRRELHAALPGDGIAVYRPVRLPIGLSGATALTFKERRKKLAKQLAAVSSTPAVRPVAEAHRRLQQRLAELGRYPDNRYHGNRATTGAAPDARRLLIYTQALDELISTVDPAVGTVLAAVRHEFAAYLAAAGGRATVGTTTATTFGDRLNEDEVLQVTARALGLRHRAAALRAQVVHAEAQNVIGRNLVTTAFGRIADESDVDVEAAEIAELRKLGLPGLKQSGSADEARAIQEKIVRVCRDIEQLKRSRDSPAVVPVQVTSNLLEQIDATTYTIRLHRMEIWCAELRMRHRDEAQDPGTEPRNDESTMSQQTGHTDEVARQLLAQIELLAHQQVEIDGIVAKLTVQN